MISNTSVYPISSALFWKAYLVQMRPYLLFVSGVAGLAGMTLNPQFSIDNWRIYVGFIPFFLGYGFGQALTDCFQTDTDKLSAPYRPLSQGIISVRQTLIVSISGLLTCAVILWYLNIYAFLLTGLSVFGLATYSKVKKNITLAGPFYNAWIVALLPIMGYFSVSQNGPLSLLPEIWFYAFVSFFSYASFVLVGYLKDIDADRTTGYKTFPVIYGWQKTIFLSDLFAALTATFFWFGFRHHLAGTLAGLLATLVIVYGQYKGHLTNQRNEKGALLSILSTVRSFVLFHLALVLHFQPDVWVAAIFFYIAFEIFLLKRPSKYQV
ncbi:MAG: hypothetical protein EOO10_10410 [Chitinophagaceae bacterium]|nr:MAG: hypothetical protein EOO10_10410 [Chitinophagaceae bacterium]